ncbi:MAG: DUF1565 domain-containing protein, partial [Planctomycetota bacterium]
MASTCTLRLMAMLTIGFTPILLSEDTRPNPASSATGRTLYVNAVNPKADDSNPGTEAAPWKTMQHGLTVAKPGDTILVMPGQYGRTVVSVSGAKDQVITIKGASVPSQDHADKTKLLDPLHPVAIPGNAALNAVTQGFDISGAAFCRIENFEITAVGKAKSGIFLEKSDGIE